MTPILEIYSHFINSKDVRRRVLLGLKEIQGRHTAKTLALVLEATLIEYKIKHRLGYTMSDNASTNDACVEALTLICCPKLKTRAMRGLPSLIALVGTSIVAHIIALVSPLIALVFNFGQQIN
ncbi:hypothetical protein E4U58_002889, partial [Claviceps cyperi]